ncbi:Cholecystokinin receptor [Trichostrongylus colubriformis]|uniref:Cholecystokinin receptor n=1 Tax=Trichostrongylus colubriformis TaxID=6319 RepID=A0AAN8ISN2_TRICO
MQQRAMRSITNIYLMNLAITDLMLSVVCMPPTLFSMVMNCWIFGNVLCKVFAYLQPMVVTASAYTLAVIAFERYYAICRPLHSRIWQTRSHAYAMIMLVWVVALAANVLMLFMYEERTYNRNGLTCTPIYEPVYHFANQVYMTIVLLAVPLVTMTVLYGSVIRTLKLGIQLEIAAVDSVDQENSTEDNEMLQRKPSYIQKLKAKLRSSKRTNALQSRNNTMIKKAMVPAMESSLRSTHIQKSAVAKQRVIKMLIVVVIIFFCCWTPSYIWWLLLMAGDSFESLELSVWNSDLNTFITLLTYISSCTNPITYCFLNKKFRTAIYAMFGRKKTLRHHFQKVYFPVNVPTSQHEKPLLNRSVSTTFSPLHLVDFRAGMPRSIVQARAEDDIALA